MSLATATRYHLPEQQAAFLGLLTTALVTPAVDAELHALIGRHRATLERWATRAAYRLVNVGSSYRLRRVPLGGTVAVPPCEPPPPRRDLVLALVIAAALEEHSADSVTLQDISDATWRLAGTAGLLPYDPDRRPHRVALVRAVDRLVGLGVLARHTDRDDLLRAWEDEGTGVGAGFVIDRDALVVLVDPYELDLALADHDRDGADAEARGARILRLLLETPSVALADLTDGERDYLVGQRARLLHQASEMTGGVVEVRADCLTLVLPEDSRHAEAATLRFPGVSTRDWVALRLLDDAARHAVEVPARPGFRLVDAAGVAGIAQQAYDDLHARLTQELRDSADAVRLAAQIELVDAGLLDVGADGSWVLRPAAARYRAADLQTADPQATESPAADPGAAGRGAAPDVRHAATAPDVRRVATAPDVRPAQRPPRAPGGTQDSLFGDLS